jgi:hypothetical protein
VEVYGERSGYVGSGRKGGPTGPENLTKAITGLEFDAGDGALCGTGSGFMNLSQMKGAASGHHKLTRVSQPDWHACPAVVAKRMHETEQCKPQQKILLEKDRKA